MAESTKVSPASCPTLTYTHTAPKLLPTPPSQTLLLPTPRSQGDKPRFVCPVPPSRPHPSSSHSPGNQTRSIKEKDLAAVQGETNGPEGRRGLERR